MNRTRRPNAPRALPACLIVLTLATTAPAQAGVSQAGAARARQLAAVGRLPSPAEIVVEHIVNYHRHGIAQPRSGEDVALDLRIDTPIDGRPDRCVLQVGLATAMLHDLSHAPPINLAIVVDCSGSMAASDKMRRVKHALHRFLDRLRADDRVAIIAYADDATVVYPSTRCRDAAARLRRVVDELEPGGSTNLHDGLMLGYREVARHRAARHTNRVILLTDGIANHGVTEPAEIAARSARHNAEGIDLSTIGVGVDLQHDLLRTLAASGRGHFHIVGDADDIGKVFDREAQSLFGVVARRPRIEVRHDADVRIDRIFGYAPTRRPDGCGVDLEDFGFGTTCVVLIECRSVPGARIEVRLAYERPHAPDARREVVRTIACPGEAARPTVDHEVRKNHAIAVMAAALRTMAEDAQRCCYGAAEQRLVDALAFVRRHYPSTTDDDILRTRRIVEDYRRILQARIERFRDL